MEDWQFGLLITAVTGGLGAIAAAVRWGAKRVTKAMDDTKATVTLNTTAMIDNTASNAVLSTKIDSVAKFVKRARTTPPQGTRFSDE